MSRVRRLKTIAKVIIGREFLIRPDIVLPTERFGSEYGGWDIVVTDISTDSVVYSFGIGEDASFDTELIKRFGVTVHAFDPTPRAIEWVRKQSLPDRFLLYPYGIGSLDGSVFFSPPDNPDNVSHTILERPSAAETRISVVVKRLSTIMRELGHDRIDLLKMDIEGAEYEVIKDIYTSGVRPHQILVEFHHRFPDVEIGMTRDAIRTIQLMGYGLFSVSPGNQEFCFIRKPF